MRIYLIGFMSSGKTTLGRQVALQQEVDFLDTDHLVETREEMSVQDIFVDKGEYYFRHIEKQVLHETVHIPRALIATGGGLPCHADNMEWILQHGISIYLEWSWDLLKPMLILGLQDRPLLSGISEKEGLQNLEKLFLSRKAWYEKAAITIEMTNDLQENVLRLKKACRYIW